MRATVKKDFRGQPSEGTVHPGARYTKDNIQLLCTICNRIKSDSTAAVEDFTVDTGNRSQNRRNARRFLRGQDMAWDDFTAEVGYAMLPRLEGVDWGQYGFVDGMDVEGRETSEGIAAAGASVCC